MSSILCSYHNAFAALGAATAWEVRTTGATTGGGGFDSGVAVPGTDYSQQDAAEDSGTDLACADGDAATPTVTSATHTFTTADEGNIINITEAGDGFTLGRYLITDTSGGGAILDRACGTDGAKTGGDWYLGGAVDHPNTISAIVKAGNIVYIKSGTYVKVGANAYVVSMTVAGISYIGYHDTRTDNPTGADRPVFDGDSDSSGTGDTTNIILNSGVDSWSWRNVIFKRATAAAIQQTYNYEIFFTNCRFTANVDGYNGAGNFLNCEFDLNTTEGLVCDRAKGVKVFYSYIHDNTEEGILGSGGPTDIAFCIIDSNTDDGYTSGGSYYCIGSIAYNNTGATNNGFNINSGTNGRTQFVINNSSVDNGKWGFNGADKQIYFDYNNYNGNGTAGLNGITAGANDNTNDPVFTGAATGDFTLDTATDTALLGLGFPQTFPGATGDYNWNIGVDQSKATTVTGGGSSTHGYGHSY